MRYNEPVVFIKETEGKYNPDTGVYDESLKTKDSKRANVTDLGTDRSVKLFGDIKEGAKVVRLLRPYNKVWDYLIIDGLTYEITKHHDLRLRSGFIVQEVIKGG